MADRFDDPIHRFIRKTRKGELHVDYLLGDPLPLGLDPGGVGASRTFRPTSGQRFPTRNMTKRPLFVVGHFRPPFGLLSSMGNPQWGQKSKYPFTLSLHQVYSHPAYAPGRYLLPPRPICHTQTRRAFFAFRRLVVIAPKSLVHFHGNRVRYTHDLFPGLFSGNHVSTRPRK